MTKLDPLTGKPVKDEPIADDSQARTALQDKKEDKAAVEVAPQCEEEPQEKSEEPEKPAEPKVADKITPEEKIKLEQEARRKEEEEAVAKSLDEHKQHGFPEKPVVCFEGEKMFAYINNEKLPYEDAIIKWQEDKIEYEKKVLAEFKKGNFEIL